MPPPTPIELEKTGGKDLAFRGGRTRLCKSEKPLITVKRDIKEGRTTIERQSEKRRPTGKTVKIRKEHGSTVPDVSKKESEETRTGGTKAAEEDRTGEKIILKGERSARYLGPGKVDIY